MPAPLIPAALTGATLLAAWLVGKSKPAAPAPPKEDKGSGGGGGGGAVKPDLQGRFPAGTAVGLVDVRQDDPNLPPGLQAGLRLNDRPASRAKGAQAVHGARPPRMAGDPTDDVASGERVAVLSGEIANSEGGWRKVMTLTGATGYMRFVDTAGTVNVAPALESAPWPTSDVAPPNIANAGDVSVAIGPAQMAGLGWANWGGPRVGAVYGTIYPNERPFHPYRRYYRSPAAPQFRARFNPADPYRARYMRPSPIQPQDPYRARFRY